MVIIGTPKPFQSLSGLTLGLNEVFLVTFLFVVLVSIPFRADTGFELVSGHQMEVLLQNMFQSLSGLTLGLNIQGFTSGYGASRVFQSLSGLTLGLNWPWECGELCFDRVFQSLSGLTLGLNEVFLVTFLFVVLVSIPFRADTGFERKHNKQGEK